MGGDRVVVLVSHPVGGILSAGPSRGSGCVTIHLCGLPEDCPCGRAGRHCPLLGLAPGGGCHPPRSPSTMVRSYRTVSALPVPARGPAIGGLFSVARTVRSLRPGSRQHPCPVESRPSSTARSPEPIRRGHPGDSPARSVLHRSRFDVSGNVAADQVRSIRRCRPARPDPGPTRGRARRRRRSWRCRRGSSRR